MKFDYKKSGLLLFSLHLMLLIQTMNTSYYKTYTRILTRTGPVFFTDHNILEKAPGDFQAETE